MAVTATVGVVVVGGVTVVVVDGSDGNGSDGSGDCTDNMTRITTTVIRAATNRTTDVCKQTDTPFLLVTVNNSTYFCNR